MQSNKKWTILLFLANSDPRGLLLKHGRRTVVIHLEQNFILNYYFTEKYILWHDSNIFYVTNQLNSFLTYSREILLFCTITVLISDETH